MTTLRKWIFAASLLALPIYFGGVDFAAAAQKGGGGTTGKFSAQCLACRNDCINRYGSDMGARQQCYRLCRVSGACTATVNPRQRGPDQLLTPTKGETKPQ